MDCCRVLRDHIEGLCLLSGSPFRAVKLFLVYFHCQPCLTEGCMRINVVELQLNVDPVHELHKHAVVSAIFYSPDILLMNEKVQHFTF